MSKKAILSLVALSFLSTHTVSAQSSKSSSRTNLTNDRPLPIFLSHITDPNPPTVPMAGTSLFGTVNENVRDNPTIPKAPISSPDDPKQPMSLVVTSDSSILSHQTKHLHSIIANFLTRANIQAPTDRLSYFVSHYKNPATQILGWKALVHKLDLTENGLVATLRVYAILNGDIDSSYVYEQYSITNGNIIYLRSIRPQNTPRYLFH